MNNNIKFLWLIICRRMCGFSGCVKYQIFTGGAEIIMAERCPLSSSDDDDDSQKGKARINSQKCAC